MTDWLAGTWTGTGSQLTGPSWSMRLSVQPQDSGNTYKIDYPSLNCGGYWELRDVSTNAVVFIEHIVYGRDRCVDLGSITVSPLPDASGSTKVVRMAWRWDGKQPSGKSDQAEAVLTRQLY
jgi:hypothetical protein